MSKKDIISWTGTVILFLCALVITILIIRKELFPPEPVVRIIENWHEIELAGTSSNQMQETVQIIKFYDYECPYCKQVQPELKTVLEKYNNQRHQGINPMNLVELYRRRA